MRSSYRRSTSSGAGLKFLGVLLLIGVLFGGCGMYQYGTVDNGVVITVTEKERVTTGSGDSISSKYLVFTDSETFENSDALFHGKWSSSDLYGSMKEGKTYRCKVYGWRAPFFSMYRNIVTAEEVQVEPELSPETDPIPTG